MEETNTNEELKIDESTNIIDLSNQKIEKIPFKIPDNNNIFTLFLSNNRIKEIPPNLIKTSNIILSFNDYDEIPESIVSTLITFIYLKGLDFSYNKITKIPNEFFTLPALKKIKFFHNKISSLPNIFNKNIATIDVGYNLITEIPTCFPNLMSFHADHNLISSLNVSFNSITKLCLSKNKITSISKSLKFPELLILDISYNQLKELPDVTSLSPQLKTIDASFNYIENFPLFPNSTINIYMQHNCIKNIDNFMGSSAVIADLSYNEIGELLDIPPFIVTFNVSHNKIKKVNQINSENIKTIDLSNNLIENIPYINCYEMQFSFNLALTVGQVSHRITVLDMTKNNLKEIPTDIFSIPIIKTILAPFNQIRSIPKGISESTIRKLDLSFNPIEKVEILPTNIERLILNYCELNSLPSSLSEYRELVEVSLIGNKIEFVNDLIPKQIQYLNLSNNKIVDFSFSNKIFRDLKYLNLSRNSIKNCQNLIFNMKLPSLSFLDLSYNPIEQTSFKLTDKEPFSLTPKLRRLILSNIKLNEELNLTNLAKICYLDLSNSLLHSKSEIESKKKMKLIKIENSEETVSYSNKLGQTEAHENYILIENIEKTTFYGVFKNFEFLSQKVVPIINGRHDMNDLAFVKNFVSDVYSPFALIIDQFKISKKIFTVFCGNFKLISIKNDFSFECLIEKSDVQEIYDEMNPFVIELNLPKNSKFLVLAEFKSIETVSCELISELASKAENASQFANLIETAFLSLDEFHNFSMIVIDCVKYS